MSRFPCSRSGPRRSSLAIEAQLPQRGSSPAWAWDDDEDEDEDEEDEGRHVVLEDQGDIEILAEDSDLEDLDRGRRRATQASGPSSRSGRPPRNTSLPKQGPVPARSTGGIGAQRISTWTPGPTARQAMWPCRSFDRAIGMRD